MNHSEQLYKLIWMSRPLMQAAEAAVERKLAATGLTVRTRAVLEILHAETEASVPDIALRLDIKRQYVQLMVNETLAEDLTIKRENPRHKRSPIIALTPKGRRLIEQVIEAEMALVEEIGKSFSAGEVETALKVAIALTEELKAGNRSN